MLAHGRVHRTTSSGAVILKKEAKYHQLATAASEKTGLGSYYEQKSGFDVPAGGFDTSQAPYREGDTEFIAMRDGTQKVVRL